LLFNTHAFLKGPSRGDGEDFSLDILPLMDAFWKTMLEDEPIKSRCVSVLLLE
jgi:hypothetical protein